MSSGRGGGHNGSSSVFRPIVTSTIVGLASKLRGHEPEGWLS